MSLLFRENIRIVLCPDRILLLRSRQGFGNCIIAKEMIAVNPTPDAPLWMASITALKEVLEKPEWQQARATVILSNHFVRYACVPGNKDIRQADEQLAYARYCFAHIYADAVDRWTVRLSPGKANSSGLASAIDTALLEALLDILSSARLQPLSIQPYLMVAFNRFRKFLKAPAWFVLLEPGKACITLLDKDSWLSVRTRNLGADWEAELPVLLERESQALVDRCDSQTVFLYACNKSLSPAFEQKTVRSLHVPASAAIASIPDYLLALAG